MTEREEIVLAMAEEITLTFDLEGLLPFEDEHERRRFIDTACVAADFALKVLEAPLDTSQASYHGICNCGQSGYPENSPHSNHPHRKGCPQYTGRHDEEESAT